MAGLRVKDAKWGSKIFLRIDLIKANDLAAEKQSVVGSNRVEMIYLLVLRAV